MSLTSSLLLAAALAGGGDALTFDEALGLADRAPTVAGAREAAARQRQLAAAA